MADDYTTAQYAVARRAVRKATRHAVYPTTSTGAPQEPYRTAIEDAVQAQLRAYRDAGALDHITTGGAAADPVLKSTSNQGASLTFDTSRADQAMDFLLAGGLAPEAEAILDDAGLLGGMPGVRRGWGWAW